MNLVKSLRMQLSTDSNAVRFVGWLSDLEDDEALAALGRDRARLMRYVDTSCIKPPYESLYVERDENDVLSDLHAFFVKEGFAPTGAYKEPADYLGMGIAFLKECCVREEAALGEGRCEEAQRLASLRSQFSLDHVCTWVPTYAESMIEAAQTGFYQTVGELLRETFLGSLLDFLLVPRQDGKTVPASWQMLCTECNLEKSVN